MVRRTGGLDGGVWGREVEPKAWLQLNVSACADNSRGGGDERVDLEEVGVRVGRANDNV